jgi:hypothetical protein
MPRSPGIVTRDVWERRWWPRDSIGEASATARLSVVPPFFAITPMEQVLGAGITAEILTDKCLYASTLTLRNDHQGMIL